MRITTKMWRIIFTFLLYVISFITGMAQTYRSIKIKNPTYSTIESSIGIEVTSISPQADGSYNVTFYNSNNDGYQYNEYITYSFDWYLSYKGKRCSDYYKSAIRERKSGIKQVFVWPGSIPKGNERYVTVQFRSGLEEKDYRDDY